MLVACQVPISTKIAWYCMIVKEVNVTYKNDQSNQNQHTTDVLIGVNMRVLCGTVSIHGFFGKHA